MSKIRNYWKNKKGITLVWGAFFLMLCLMFLGLAADIAYMYVAKNQLQVAADASSLAGGAYLTLEVDNNSSVLIQEEARQKAWEFACKNNAAGSKVYLVTNTPPDCDPNNLPHGNDLNSGNTADGDIVVGHWSYTCPSGFSCGVGQACELAGSGYFCPANGGTGLTINAIKVVPRRTGTKTNPDTPGMPPVSLFIGQIFRILGGGEGWSVMSARASAIAAFVPAKVLPIAVNEYWLQRDASKRPYPNSIHEYPSSFVRKTNVDGTSSQAWGKIFAILGSDANDNIPANQNPGSQNMNGYIQMNFRSFNHDGSGISWYQVNINSASSINCTNCITGFSGPIAKNTGFVQQDKFDESLQYLHEGYNYILPTAVREQFRGNYPASNYPIPTSSCPFATLPYFSSSGSQPINKKYNNKTFDQNFPKGTKIMTLVYDGTFSPDVNPNMPNAVTNLGYILLQIDGYASSNPKNLKLDQTTNDLTNSGNTVYAHALSDIVEPASSFGTCDETFLGMIRDLQRLGGEVKLVK